MAETVIVRRKPPERSCVVHDHPLVSTLLQARGISEPLDFALQQLPKPNSLAGMEQATQLLAGAIAQQRNILIVGDYDCDGATSTTLALLALRQMGAEFVDYFVPSRFVHGYGLSPEIVDLAAGRGVDLIITVDNGVASVSGVERARELGIDVVVTDHHLPPDILPKAAALVNPNLKHATFASRNIAGVGVIFFVMIALRSVLTERGWFDAQSIAAPNMGAFLDLVAIGTVADVVPLDQVNRVLVEQGIRRMRAGQSRPGVAALLEVASMVPGRLVAQDIGFLLAPRLNAAGRLDDMSIGIECLLSEEPARACQLATELNSLNEQRRQIERQMREQSEHQVEKVLAQADASEVARLSGTEEHQVGYRNNVSLCLYEADWNQGVIGILAGRLKDKLHMPVFVFAPDQLPGKIKGSGRSIQGLHLLDVLKQVKNDNPELFDKFGGHAMAAGLEIDEADFQIFSDAFDYAVRAILIDGLPTRRFLSDGALPLKYFNTETAELLKRVAPWGQAFEAPLFDNLFEISFVRVLKGEHLKLGLVPQLPEPLEPPGQAQLGGSHSSTCKPTVSQAAAVVQAIYFRCLAPGKLPTFGVGDLIRVAYRLDVNHFRGDTTTQLMIEHIEGFSTQNG